jgi:hypothetical protein
MTNENGRSRAVVITKFDCTGGPRYMREIGTVKYVSHITNSHIKRPRITIKERIGSIKKDHSQSHIREFADKKTAYNEVRLYIISSY